MTAPRTKEQGQGTIVFVTDLMSFVEKRQVSVDGKTWMPRFETLEAAERKAK